MNLNGHGAVLDGLELASLPRDTWLEVMVALRPAARPSQRRQAFDELLKVAPPHWDAQLEELVAREADRQQRVMVGGVDFTVVMTPRAVAAAFGVDRKTVAVWANRGLLDCIWTRGGKRRYSRAQVEGRLGGRIDRDLIGVPEAAEMYAVDPITIKRWVRAGKLACFRTPGGQMRFDRGDIAADMQPRRWARSPTTMTATSEAMEAMKATGTVTGEQST